MKLSSMLATFAVLAAADARSRFFQRPAQFVPLPSLSEGSSNANINSGISQTPQGETQIKELTADSAGRTQGLGSISFNTANTNTRRTETIHGVQQTADVDSSSVQDTSRVGLLVPFGRPHGSFQGFFGGGGASGQASSGVAQGQTIGVGGVSSLVSVTSNSGGEAHNGGSNVSGGRAGHRRTETVEGVDEESHADSESVQRSRR